MYKYITSFFSFILPVLRQALLETAVKEIETILYADQPHRRPVRRYTPSRQYRRPRPASGSPNYYRQRMGLEPAPFHDVIMVAFDLSGRNAQDVHAWLQDNMPSAGDHGDAGEINLDSWWIANDERFDGSDTHSAVFVSKGNQDEARALLRKHGLVT